MQNDPLDIWRLAEDLSVVDAAILIVGGDPSLRDLIESDRYLNEGTHYVKRTDSHPGFQGAFTALRAAIQNNILSVDFHPELSRLGA